MKQTRRRKENRVTDTSNARRQKTNTTRGSKLMRTTRRREERKPDFVHHHSFTSNFRALSTGHLGFPSCSSFLPWLLRSSSSIFLLPLFLFSLPCGQVRATERGDTVSETIFPFQRMEDGRNEIQPMNE